MYWVINCLHSQLLMGFNVLSVKSSCHVVSQQQEPFGTPAQVWFAGEELKMSIHSSSCTAGVGGWHSPVLFHQTLPEGAGQITAVGCSTSLFKTIALCPLGWEDSRGGVSHRRWTLGIPGQCAAPVSVFSPRRSPVSQLTSSSAMSCCTLVFPSKQDWNPSSDLKTATVFSLMGEPSLLCALPLSQGFLCFAKVHVHQEMDQPSSWGIIISV